MQIDKIFNKLDNKFKSHKFSELKFDSYECKKGDIFFAIKGAKKNGNNFINHAIKKGAKTIISDLKFEGYKKDVLFLNSEDPRKSLSLAASKIFSKKPKNLIAVTGTNGKSSVANFFFQILKLNKIKAASIGTLGIISSKSKSYTKNTTLDPLTIHKTLQKLKKNKINNVILEASSHGLKQKRLHGIKFNIGIFTNFSRDHLDYHKSYKDYFNSKMILFNNLMKKKSKIIYDNQIPQSSLIKKTSRKNKIKELVIGKKNANINFIDNKFFGKFQNVKFTYNKKNYFFKTKLLGKTQIMNLMMAIIAASCVKIKMKNIIKCIKKIEPVHGRFEEVGNLKNNSKIILDYAHTPDALENCLKDIKTQFKTSKISVLFGCGGERDVRKREIMGNIADLYCDKIYLTDDNPRGENPQKIRNQIKKNIKKNKLNEIPSREKAIAKSILDLNSGDILIIAGRGHEIYQEYKTKKNFSDKKCILKNVNLKNKYLHKDWKINIVNEKIKNFKFKKNQRINFASINSKEIKKNDIFFGIKGKKHDGNKYSIEAIKNGATVSFVDKKYFKKSKKIILVKNSLKLLSNLSSDVRKTSFIKSIAITGSSGKTSLKELLGQSLKKIISTSYSKNSFNNKYGVPLSLFNIKKNNFFGIFEVGMNKKGEIDALSKLIKPDLSIITNISYAHIQNFKNLKEVAETKSEIINNTCTGGTVILNRDDNYYNFLKNKAEKKKLKIVSFSKKRDADIKLIKISRRESSSFLYISIKGEIKKFFIKKNVEKYIYNILSSIAVISEYFEIKNIKNNIFYNFKEPKGRGDQIKIMSGDKIVNIIDESYNSNPLSLKFAIDNLNKLKASSKHKYLLLGDMLELGKFSKKLHIDIAKTINKSNINKVYVYGNYIKDTFKRIKKVKKGKILNSKKSIIKLIKDDLNDKDFIMVKGSNATGLNKIISEIKLGL